MGVCLGTQSTASNLEDKEPESELDVSKPLCILREQLVQAIYWNLQLSDQENQIFDHQKYNDQFKSPFFQHTHLDNAIANSSQPQRALIKPRFTDFIPYHEILLDQFRIFCTYRFYHSHTKAMALRKEELKTLQKARNLNDYAGEEEEIFMSQEAMKRLKTRKTMILKEDIMGQNKWIARKNLYNEEEDHFNALEEDNMLVVSWVNDLGNDSREFEDKILFFNNESILNSKKQRLLVQGYPKTTIIEHFNDPLRYRKIFAEQNIEFQCKKGGGYSSFNTNFYMPKKQNQDNFFIVNDSELKIFGVFDGHGEYGHLVSGFVSGIMLDYIRNKDKAFRVSCLFDQDNSFDLDIRRAMRRCFKYTQERLKVIYKSYLQQEKLKKLAEKNKFDVGRINRQQPPPVHKNFNSDYELPIKLTRDSNESAADFQLFDHHQQSTSDLNKITDYLQNDLEDQELWSESSWDPNDDHEAELEIPNLSENASQMKEFKKNSSAQKISRNAVNGSFSPKIKKKFNILGGGSSSPRNKEKDMDYNESNDSCYGDEDYGNEEDYDEEDNNRKRKRNNQKYQNYNSDNDSLQDLNDSEDVQDDGDLSR